jgi:Flp pilus assembly protein TadD
MSAMEDLASIPTDQLRRMAAAAAGQSNVAGAEAALRELARREPRNAETVLALAQVLKAQGERREALAAARRAVALAPRDPRAQLGLAQALLMTGQMEAAARAFETLVRTSPNNAEMWTSYGMALERIRRPADARTAAERALAIDARNGRALNLLGQLLAEAGESERAEACYERAVRDATEPPARAMAWHRLGALREKQGRWDEAFDCHDRGNRVQLGTSVARHAPSGPVYPTLWRSMPEGCEAMVARWGRARFPSDRPDPVFLVGFPRSGTTLTEQVLGALPGTVTSDEEPVLDAMRDAAARACDATGAPSVMEALDGLTDAQIIGLRAEYWRSVERMIGPEALRARLFVDKQPLRFVHAALVNRVFPGCRIVFVVRDPRDVCLSCFFQDFAPHGPMARSTTLEGIGELYVEVMTFWMRARSRMSVPVLEVRYEDMVADFEPHARRLVEFVGGAWTDEILRFQERASTRAIRTPSFRAVTEKVNTRAVGKWARYEKHLGPLLERVGPMLGPLGYADGSAEHAP